AFGLAMEALANASCPRAEREAPEPRCEKCADMPHSSANSGGQEILITSVADDRPLMCRLHTILDRLVPSTPQGGSPCAALQVTSAAGLSFGRHRGRSPSNQRSFHHGHDR